jgi:hypothetical protein
MSLQRFAELIQQTTGVVYDKATLSRMETGERKVSIEDIEAIAQVDPLKRGRAWLAVWDDEEGEQGAERQPDNPQHPPTEVIPRTRGGYDYPGAKDIDPGRSHPQKKKTAAPPKRGRMTSVA